MSRGVAIWESLSPSGCPGVTARAVELYQRRTGSARRALVFAAEPQHWASLGRQAAQPLRDTPPFFCFQAGCRRGTWLLRPPPDGGGHERRFDERD